MANELEQGPIPDTTISPSSVPMRCAVCGGTVHVETIGVQDYYVCDDVTCMWMEPV